MKKSKHTKRALLSSIVALLLCFTMLLGTTFAWFTDTVSSSGNKIQSGTLKVDLEVLDRDTGKWVSVGNMTEPIFHYDNWEPGYTQVKVLRVVNKGTLALKWKAMLLSGGPLTELADVIDVYVKEDVTAYPSAPAEVTGDNGWTNIGSLTEFVNSVESTTTGNIAAGEGNHEALGIAFKMQESAPNKYQGMRLGGAFDICIVAAQDTVESDSFNNLFDQNAEYGLPTWKGDVTDPSDLYITEDTVNNVKTIGVSGGNNLAAAFEYINASTDNTAFVIDIQNDFSMGNINWTYSITKTNAVTVKGNDHVIADWYTNTQDGLFTGYHKGSVSIENLTVRNSTVEQAGNDAGLLIGGIDNEPSEITNCTIENAFVEGENYVGGFVGWASGGVTIENCKVVNSKFVGGGSTGSFIGHDSFVNIVNPVAKNNTILGEDLPHSGVVIGTSNDGSQNTITYDTANVSGNYIVDHACDSVYGRSVTGTLYLNGVAAPNTVDHTH